MVNLEARKARHQRLFSYREIVKPTEIPTSSSAERQFFRRIAIFAGSFFLVFQVFHAFFLTISPQSEDIMVQEFQPQKLTLAEDGFLVKPATQAQKSDVSKFTKAVEYTVEQGDTVSRLAERFGVSSQTLQLSNHLSSIKLKPGQKLTIPPVNGLMHTVEKGDTLDSIAKKYQVQTQVIVSQNALSGKKIALGQELIIPGGKEYVPPAPPKSKRTPQGRDKGYYARGETPNTFYSGPTGGALIKPAAGLLAQGYHRGHYAIDISNRSRGPIFAARSGVVIRSQCGWNGGYGCVVEIDHGDGVKTLYAHNQKLFVSTGDRVKQGQTISWMGNTGRVYGATGIHVHFEVIDHGVKRNPFGYF